MQQYLDKSGTAYRKRKEKENCHLIGELKRKLVVVRAMPCAQMWNFFFFFPQNPVVE